MDTATIVIVVILIGLLAAGGALLLLQRNRSQHLRERFGPEYERALHERGDRRAAERELAGRERRREQLDIRPLDPDARARYAESWRAVQARFVDEPDVAAHDAHELVTRVMQDRGYPMDDFEQRAADISVDHPEIVQDYRVANRIVAGSADGATTEDLREAMVRYRSLFAALLQDGDEAASPHTREETTR